MSTFKQESYVQTEPAHMEMAPASVSTSKAVDGRTIDLENEITAYEHRKMDFRTVMAIIVRSSVPNVWSTYQKSNSLIGSCFYLRSCPPILCPSNSDPLHY